MVVLLLIGLGTYMSFFAAPPPIPLKRPLVELPQSFAGWYGQESSWFKGASYFPGLDASIARTYRTASGREVHLFVGYVESQVQGKSLVSHQAKSLHEGLRVVSSGLGAPGPQWVNRSTFANGERRYATLFWYWPTAGDLTGRQHVRLRAIFDAVAHRRNNGAVILLAAPLADKNMEAIVWKDLLAFARDLTPRLVELLP
jgi:EpsI family protein